MKREPGFLIFTTFMVIFFFYGSWDQKLLRPIFRAIDEHHKAALMFTRKSSAEADGEERVLENIENKIKINTADWVLETLFTERISHIYRAQKSVHNHRI